MLQFSFLRWNHQNHSTGFSGVHSGQWRDVNVIAVLGTETDALLHHVIICFCFPVYFIWRQFLFYYCLVLRWLWHTILSVLFFLCFGNCLVQLIASFGILLKWKWLQLVTRGCIDPFIFSVVFLCRFLCDSWNKPLCLFLFGSESCFAIQIWLTIIVMLTKVVMTTMKSLWLRRYN